MGETTQLFVKSCLNGQITPSQSFHGVNSSSLNLIRSRSLPLDLA